MKLEHTDLAYHPITKEYLEYLLQRLNHDDAGAGIFAQIAEGLIHRRKCANIVPATSPSYGGDYGQDGRTQEVLLDSDGRFRLYTSPPIVDKRWIFAFSITEKWQSKLESDCQKIIENNLNPDRIVFVTNQRIHPERVKIDAERSITAKFQVECEILDGHWILTHLYHDDYELAVQFLKCPPEEDPELMAMFRRVYGLKSTGLTEQEALELERIKARVQYRNRYIGIPEHLIQDLHRIGNILAQYEKHLEEAIKWYEEALPELKGIIILPDGIELMYSYFKALFKISDGHQKIYALLPQFIDMVILSQASSLYVYVSTWLSYLFPKYLDNAEFRKLYASTLERFQKIAQSTLGLLSKLYVDETLLYLDVLAPHKFLSNKTVDFKPVEGFLRATEQEVGFPVYRIAKILGNLGPYMEGNADYETCFELALKLESQYQGNINQANTLKARAFAHEKAGQLTSAIKLATRAKQLWLTESSIRGYLLSCFVLSDWYSTLGYYQAAEYEMYEALTLMFWQPKYKFDDLLVAVPFKAAILAFMQGRVARAYHWLYVHIRFAQLYRIELNSELIQHYFLNNLQPLLMRYYAKNRYVHDILTNIADKVNPAILDDYRVLFLGTVQEFEEWINDDQLTDEVKNDLVETRQRVHAGTLELPSDIPEYDEFSEAQYITWQVNIPYHDNLEIQFEYANDTDLERAAVSLACGVQIWLVYFKDAVNKLTFADDKLLIRLSKVKRNKIKDFSCSYASTSSEGTTILIEITEEFIPELDGSEIQPYIHFLVTSLVTMIDYLVLDDNLEIENLFSPNNFAEVIKRMSMVAHLPYILNQVTIVKEVVKNNGTITL